MDVLKTLDSLSQGRLARRNDLGALIELAAQADRKAVLEELSFFAKFVSKAAGIMTRIGTAGQGYESLKREVALNLEKVVALIHSLLEGAPPEVRDAFAGRYLAGTPDAAEDLLGLCQDLGWYKNWLIDR